MQIQEIRHSELDPPLLILVLGTLRPYSSSYLATYL